MESPSKLKNRLNRYKKKNRYSIKLLAAEIRVGQSWLTDFCNGKYPDPTYSYMLKVSKYLERKDK